MSITENFIKIKRQIPENVKLIAVSKTKPVNEILEVYNTGHKIFGENKAQEISDKYEKLPKDIEWHFIGHLQSNKIKYIAPFIYLIHGVDSYKLLKEIDKEGKKNNRIISCLLQFHIATEDTKYGFSIDEACEMLDDKYFIGLKNIEIHGVMGMATYTEDVDLIRNEFKQLKHYFDLIKERYFYKAEHFKDISMGMSDDYNIAIEEHSTIVRIGSAIFGLRNYKF